MSRRPARLLRLGVLGALLGVLALPAGHALAGRMVLTGHIPDHSCGFPETPANATRCGFVAKAITYVRGGAPNPSLPVLVLTNGQQDLPEAIRRAFEPDIPVRVVVPSSAAFAGVAITTANFSAMVVASDRTCDGCDLNPVEVEDSLLLGSRAAEIRAFFDAGGGIYANAGAQHGDGVALPAPEAYYAFLPVAVTGGVSVQPPGSVTPVGATVLGLTSGDVGGRISNSFAAPGVGSFLRAAEVETAAPNRIITLVGERDGAPPQVVVPADQTIEAVGPGGSPFTFTAAAQDAIAGAITPSCSPPSGSTFPLGATQVQCSATDPSGNVGGAAFTVTVRDTQPPALTVPPGVVQEEGTRLEFGATATDLVDGAVTPGCSPAPGAPVPPGATTVTRTARDRAGNLATARFTLTGTAPDGPAIASIAPGRSVPGGQIVIRGRGFGRAQGDGSVRIGGRVAAVDSWSATRIVAFLPAVQAGAREVEVRPAAGGLLRGPLTVLPAVQHFPEANLLAEPLDTPSGLTVRFDATLSIDPDLLSSGALVGAEHGELQISAGLDVQWDFGDDGPGSKAAVVTHTYQQPGDYTVRLRVTDRSNRSTTVTKRVPVWPPVQTVVRTVNGVRRVVTVRRVPVFRPVNIRIPSQIVFDFGSSALRRESRSYLLRVARVVRRSPRVTRVAGYTDSIGSAGYNLRLSRLRAQKVRTFLAQRGRVRARLLRAVGFGERRPLASNRTELGRQKNRRVVLTVQLRVGTRRI